MCSWTIYAVIFLGSFIAFKFNIILSLFVYSLECITCRGRYLGYITDKDSVNMTGLYMMSQFILFPISRLAILKFKPEYKSVLNLWF